LTLVRGVSFDSGMTERKPAGKSWESWREELIRLAQEEGAFDNLAGAGKPFADLGESYDPDWWVKKLVQREKVSMLPPALELLRKVEAQVEQIWKLSDEAEVRERMRSLNGEIARANARAAEGPPTRLAPLDADTIVAQWRAVRTPGPSRR
jgi:DnaJ-like protein